jgi:hypothetical protein
LMIHRFRFEREVASGCVSIPPMKLVHSAHRNHNQLSLLLQH